MANHRINWAGLVFSLALLLGWELLARAMATPSLPGVVEVALALVDDAAVLAAEVLVSLGRALAGFAIVLVTMLPLGIFLGRTPRIARFVEPLIDLLRPLPPLAIVPLAMLLAGTGNAAKISVIVYSASFPLLINAIDATRATHPLLIQVGRSVGLSPAAIMRRIDLPAALPQIATGIRLSLSLSLLIGISSEMLLSSNGMGNYLMRSQEQFQIANGLAGMVVIAAVALLMNTAVLRLEGRLLAWHHARNRLPAA